LSRWVKNRPVNCHDALTACQGCEQASDASRIFAALIESAQKGLYHLSKNKMGGRALSAQPQAGEAHHMGEAEAD